jgi:quinohemoprotein ethanol dehydrogenase
MERTEGNKSAQASSGMRARARILTAAAAVALAALPTPAQWSTVGGDQGNTRYSSLSQINSQNISKLGAAWISDKIGPPPSSRAMPVIDAGLLFVTAPPFVTAVNLADGKIAWQYRLASDTVPGAPVAGSPAREGVAIGEGLVFVGLSDSNLVALDEKNGTLVWKQSLKDPKGANTGGPSGAPLYHDGLVSIGTNGDNGNRGQIVALDAKTGKEVWRFFVVPAPGDPGSETWPKNDSWKRGGGAVWLVGAFDPALDMVYYVTGNGVPQYGGENRAGDNLFLCSVLAFESKTGKLRWHYQVIRHDIWEADIAEAPVLFDAQVNREPRKAIAAIRTDGYLFMLDRVTGKPLGRVEDRRVDQDAFQKTAATQPYPVGAEPVLPDCADWKKQMLPRGFELGCFFTPATIGKENVIAPVYGMRATPMAFDPQTQFFYATGNAGLQWFRRAEDPDFFGMGFNSRVPGINKLSYGVLAAIDTRTDKIAWEKKFPGLRPSGALATAGGLLFQMAGDGTMQAYDPATGNLLWQFQTGTASGSPPIAFESAGDEYIATIVSGSVWAFKLGGNLPQGAAPKLAVPEDFGGAPVDASVIETSTMVRDAGLTGAHYMIDEYEFTPFRARIKAGGSVTWRNNGRLVHTIVAEDGAWTTGPLRPLDFAAVKFDKPGTYTYICKEYPWVYGQIIVEPPDSASAAAQPSGK